MIYNQLVVLPTDDTLKFLSSVMSDSPIDLDLSSYHLVITTTLDEIDPMPDLLYTAQTISVRVWYDAHLQTSSLIASFESSDLQKRAMHLLQAGVLREFHDYFNPHMILRLHMPPMRRHASRFVRNLGDSLCAVDRPLQFHGEFVRTVDLQAPPNYEYEQAMTAEHMARRNI